MLFWPLYSEHHVSKYVCASVPLMAAGHFALVGIGIVVDKALVASATVSAASCILEERQPFCGDEKVDSCVHDGGTMDHTSFFKSGYA